MVGEEDSEAQRATSKDDASTGLGDKVVDVGESKYTADVRMEGGCESAGLGTNGGITRVKLK